MKRLLIVDIANLYYSVQQKYNCKLNYEEYVKLALADCSYSKSLAYGTEKPDADPSAFITALKHLGFELKYTISYSGRHTDWNVGITIDVIKRLDSFDSIVFGTGNGHLAPCLEYIKSKGKQTGVLACNISYKLREVADWTREISTDMLLP